MLDFEAYVEDGKYWVKEICILFNGDTDHCYNYFVKAHKMGWNNPDSQNFQFRRHGLRKDFGDYHFNEAIRDIQNKVGNDKVYVKGLEKTNFIKLYLPNVEELVDYGAFKDYNQFMMECCGFAHSMLFCARRKCFVLHEIFIQKQAN